MRKIFNLRLDQRQIAAVDFAVAKFGFRSRTDALRYIISLFEEKEGLLVVQKAGEI